jgi:hypothetical protein
MADRLSPDAGAMRAHLEHLFGAATCADGDALIEIAWIGEPRHGRQDRDVGAYLRPFSDLDRLVAEAVRRNSAGANVYVGAALRRPDTAPFRRARDADFHMATALWADLDSDGATAEASLRWEHCPPTLVVITASRPHYRAHAWWRLDHPLRDAGRARRSIEGMAHCLGGDPAIRNPSRIMRLAGSINRPFAEKRQKGRVDELVRIRRLEEPARPAHRIEEIEQAFPMPKPAASYAPPPGLPLAKIIIGQKADAYFKAAVDGVLKELSSTPQGERNTAAFASFCRLIELGIAPSQVAQSVINACLSNGLRKSEAEAVVKSAGRHKGISLC